MATSAAGLTVDTVVAEAGSCRVQLDSVHSVAVVTDPDDTVVAYLIGNSAVETQAEVHIGSTAEDLETAYPDATLTPLGDADGDGADDGTVVVTVPQVLTDEIRGEATERALLFVVGPDGLVTAWAAGRVEYLVSPCGEGD